MKDVAKEHFSVILLYTDWNPGIYTKVNLA